MCQANGEQTKNKEEEAMSEKNTGRCGEQMKKKKDSM